MKFCGEPFNIRRHYSSISGYVYLGFNEAAIQFAPIFSTQKDMCTQLIFLFQFALWFQLYYQMSFLCWKFEGI